MKEIEKEFEIVINEFVNNSQMMKCIGPMNKLVYCFEISYKTIFPYVNDMETSNLFPGLSKLVLNGACSFELKLPNFNNNEWFWAIIVNRDIISRFTRDENRFIVFHELGHIMLRHLVDDYKLQPKLSKEGLLNDPKYEIEADKYAISMGGKAKFTTVYKYLIYNTKELLCFVDDKKIKKFLLLRITFLTYWFANLGRVIRMIRR